MKISVNTYQTHQFTGSEFEALENSEKILEHIQDSYGEKCVLMSPNDGEIVEVNELARVRGILSFLMRNRVVEVNAKLD